MVELKETVNAELICPEIQRDVSTQVIKPIPHELDLGLLAIFDPNYIDTNQIKSELYLQDITRDGVQALINALWSLPIKSTENGAEVDLPNRHTILPREKPIPKPKPLTRWEKFAKVKGINNKKRDRMILDEATGEYKPRYGYKSVKQEEPWLLEVPDNKDPLEDQYAKRREEKKERINKNKGQMRRNEDAATTNSSSKSKSHKDITTTSKLNSLKQKMKATKSSSASLGRHDPAVRGEPKQKHLKKQKVHEQFNFAQEKGRASAILNQILDVKV